MRAVIAFLLLLAQGPVAFEVVSIKPSDERAILTSWGTSLRGNQWTGEHVTLRHLIQDSRESDGFDLPDRIVGGPAWIDKDHFDITASTGTPPAKPQLEAMIRAMLVDRFHLTSHFEKKTLPAYELVPSRPGGAPGPKLVRATTDCSPHCVLSIMFGPTRRMTSAGIEMTRFAFVLSTVVKRPVIDRTGLPGQFTLNLEFAPPDELTASPDAPSLFTALEEQLGLKLRAVREPLDVLVVDHADKPSFD